MQRITDPQDIAYQLALKAALKYAPLLGFSLYDEFRIHDKIDGYKGGVCISYYGYHNKGSKSSDSGFYRGSAIALDYPKSMPDVSFSAVDTQKIIDAIAGYESIFAATEQPFDKRTVDITVGSKALSINFKDRGFDLDRLFALARQPYWPYPPNIYTTMTAIPNKVVQSLGEMGLLNNSVLPLKLYFRENLNRSFAPVNIQDISGYEESRLKYNGQKEQSLPCISQASIYHTNWYEATINFEMTSALSYQQGKALAEQIRNMLTAEGVLLAERKVSRILLNTNSFTNELTNSTSQEDEAAKTTVVVAAEPEKTNQQSPLASASLFSHQAAATAATPEGEIERKEPASMKCG